MTPQELFREERRSNRFADLTEYAAALSLTYVCVTDFFLGDQIYVFIGQVVLLAYVLTNIAWRLKTGTSLFGPEVLMCTLLVLISAGIMFDTYYSTAWIYTAMVGAFLSTGFVFATRYAFALALCSVGALAFIGKYEYMVMTMPAFVFTAFFVATCIMRFDALQLDLIKLSAIDNLTGAYNRNFLNRLQGNRNYTYRMCRPLLIDLDDFKGVNDTYGHTEGDRVLREVCDVVSDELTPSSTLFRLGGDEFMILMFDTSEEAALDLRDQISMAMPSRVQCGVRSITVTIGVGSVTTVADLEGAFDQADFDMLNAKAGRRKDPNPREGYSNRSSSRQEIDREAG